MHTECAAVASVGDADSCGPRTMGAQIPTERTYADSAQKATPRNMGSLCAERWNSATARMTTSLPTPETEAQPQNAVGRSDWLGERPLAEVILEQSFKERAEELRRAYAESSSTDGGKPSP